MTVGATFLVIKLPLNDNVLLSTGPRPERAAVGGESCEEGRHYGIVAIGDELFLTMPLKSVVIFLCQHLF